RDKLTTFILKNPPESKKGAKDKKAMRRAEKERLKEGEAADEELKKLKKETKKKVSSKEATAKPTLKKKASGSDEDHASPPKRHVNVREEEEEDDDDVQWQTDTSMEAAQQRIQEQLSAVTAEMVMLSTNETEKKPKAATTQARQSSKVVSAPSEDDPKAENGEKTSETLVEDVKIHLKKGVTASQFRSFLGSLSGSPQDIVTAVYEALLDDVEKAFAKELMKKKGYLLAAVGQDDGSQLCLLRALEVFCGKSNPAAVKEVALVLKALYDADVLEEEFIVQWYQEGVAGVQKDSKIWKNVKPFIDWLQSAESESEED
ncbi:hypothetical protein EJD97_014533, partial [Solanum chilense]